MNSDPPAVDASTVSPVLDTAPAASPSVIAEPPAAPHPDDGIRRLDPRSIALNRMVNSITAVVLCGGLLIAALVLWLTGEDAAATMAGIAWFPIAALMLWLVVKWPAIEYRHWRYRIGAGEIEIWSGVLWRDAAVVPRSRVQHIDVSQGPIERSFGLATLSVYTAGTQYSRVQLPGLDHAVALAVRDALLPKDVEPAV